MYEATCPDIFNGGRDKALQVLDELKLDNDLTEYMEDVIYISGDLAWMLTALAKLHNGEEKLSKPIAERWEQIKPKYEAAYKSFSEIREGSPTLHAYWKTIHTSTIAFIEQVMSDSTENTQYHPYGFGYFMAMAIRNSYDFLSFLSRDADGNLETISTVEDEIYDSVVNLTTTGYASLMSMRFKLAQETEMFLDEINYRYMFTNNMSLREFRGMLLLLINVDMLKRPNISGLDELVRAIQDGGIVDIINLEGKGRGHRGGGGRGRSLPTDIEDMFDD